MASAQEILEKRLAKGEITEEEFEKLSNKIEKTLISEQLEKPNKSLKINKFIGIGLMIVSAAWLVLLTIGFTNSEVVSGPNGFGIVIIAVLVLTFLFGFSKLNAK